ncbi:replication initiation protein [Pseudomonas putida]|uniref:replication initiation protein n=1 Tax=Pseudomonas putida TaxID=303 RepID=UPI0009B9CD90|nr:replication initiation protein [Pseudomonas putida]ELU0816423.1 replication initiation protein [Pseudomonas putida]MCE0971489.1 replication initiation protein [Pseudomonas putida]MDD2116625.1 replication initiation protein [Pseudomonas putida]UPU93953.1 replication initiation protein [Pseudomonas putida]HDS1731043.1 replication initiation protein [Pseudomonas putida]
MRYAPSRLESALELYKSKLPSKPYYTNNYSFGKKVASLKTALKSNYIQPNSATHKYFLIFDLDSEISAMDWSNKGLPAPHLIVRNLDNGRSHMTYILKTSVKIDVSGRLKPLKYCSDVEHGLAVRVGADMNYNGLLTKNPFQSSEYSVFSFEDEPYDLDYLNEFVDKDLVKQQREAKKKKNVEDGFASGRNCTLFDNLRHWAYSNWHRFHQVELNAQILDQAMLFNTFECPLGMNEVRTIADSVYRFITQQFSIERLNELKSERAKQSRQKSKGNVIYTGDKPWETEGIPKRTYYYRKANGVESERQTISEAKPWEKLGISRATFYRKVKDGTIELA